MVHVRVRFPEGCKSKLQIMKKLQAFMKRLERAVRLRRYNDIRDLLSVDMATSWEWNDADQDTKTEYDDLKHRAGEMTNSN